MTKSILFVSGRYVVENPYRELRLKELFESRGKEVLFALPSRNLNQQGYPDSIKLDPVFKVAGAKWLDSVLDFKNWLKDCDGVLFGSWKSYGLLAQMARSSGKAVLNFNSTSGLDHWVHGVSYSCVKGPFSKRQILYYHEQLSGYGNLKKEQIIITGSIIHERYAVNGITSYNKMNREEFCHNYNLDPLLPIVVLLPKGIGSLMKKIPRWFPDWDEKKCSAYNEWFLKKYANICKLVNEAECNLIVKMHPSAYASYLSKTNEEYDYWKRFPWVRVLAPEHVHQCYVNCDFGVGINTHSALDFGFFGKPFIYVDSDQIEPPPQLQFHINDLCDLPPGPSSEWSKNPRSHINPWFPSWLGFFSRVKDLPELVNGNLNFQITPEDRDRFIREFWYKADGQSANRIVEFVSEYIQSWNSKKKIYQIIGQRFSQVNDVPKSVYLSFRKKLSTVLGSIF